MRNRFGVFALVLTMVVGTTVYADGPAPSQTNYVPSILGTYTGVLGLDGVHLIEHRQALVLVSPWTPDGGCREAHVAISFFNNNGGTIGFGNEVVPRCGQFVIESPDLRYGLDLNGALIKIESDVPLAAAWRITPAYEWPVPPTLVELGRGIEEAGNRFLLFDVDYNSTPQSNGPEPPFVPTSTKVYIKIVNPSPSPMPVTVSVMGHDSKGSEIFVHQEVIPPNGERMVALHDIIPSFSGQVVVQSVMGDPLLIWAWRFQEPRLYKEAPLIIMELPFVKINPGPVS